MGTDTQAGQPPSWRVTQPELATEKVAPNEACLEAFYDGRVSPHKMTAIINHVGRDREFRISRGFRDHADPLEVYTDQQMFRRRFRFKWRDVFTSHPILFFSSNFFVQVTPIFTSIRIEQTTQADDKFEVRKKVWKSTQLCLRYCSKCFSSAGCLMKF